MLISRIEQELSIFPSFRALKHYSDGEINSISTVDGSFEAFQKHTIYIGIMHKAQEIPENCVFVTNEDNTHFSGNGAVFYLDNDDYFKCYNTLYGLFMKQQAYEIAYSQIMYKLVNHESLHEAVEMTAEFLDRSIVLTDLSFKILDYSTSKEVTDPLWLSYISKGYCTRDFIEAMNDLLPKNQMPSDSSAFPVNCSVSTENKLCSKLVYNNQHIGYLILLDNEAGLLPYHYEFLPRLSNLMVEFLRAQPDFDIYFLGVSGGIFINLIQGEDPTLSKQRLFATGVSLPDSMVCVLFNPKVDSSHFQAYIESQAKSLFSMSQTFTHGQFVVSIISSKSLDILESIDVNSDILAYVSEIGVSSVFDDIAMLPECFREAARSCHLSHRVTPDTKICFYQDYLFFDLINSCTDRNLLRRSIHPAFDRLADYDVKKEASLLMTLLSYIKNDFNAKSTADDLFLHRNTLKYRLDKISSLTGIDYENPEDKFQLLFSYRVNLLLEIYS